MQFPPWPKNFVLCLCKDPKGRTWGKTTTTTTQPQQYTLLFWVSVWKARLAHEDLKVCVFPQQRLLSPLLVLWGVSMSPWQVAGSPLLSSLASLWSRFLLLTITITAVTAGEPWARRTPAGCQKTRSGATCLTFLSYSAHQHYPFSW